MKSRWFQGFVWLVGLAAMALAVPQIPSSQGPPDLIVTHLSHRSGMLSVHLQNLGPGEAHGKVRLRLRRHHRGQQAIEIEMSAPRGVFAVAKSQPVPLKDLGVKPNWNSELLEVKIQADEPQLRTSNKNFYEQIERNPTAIHNGSRPYQEAHPNLPDLVIERVEYEHPHYLNVVYANRGLGRTGADFVISVSTPDRKFPPNHYYRYRVPPPGERRTTGGFTIGILGLKPGMSAPLTVTIDPEERVHETNSRNNTWKGVVELKP